MRTFFSRGVRKRALEEQRRLELSEVRRKQAAEVTPLSKDEAQTLIEQIRGRKAQRESALGDAGATRKLTPKERKRLKRHEGRKGRRRTGRR